MNAVRAAQITHQVHLMLGGLTGILSTLTPDEKSFVLELINQWRMQQGGSSQQAFAPVVFQQPSVQEVVVQKPAAAVPASKPSAPKSVQKKETSKPGTWVQTAKKAVKPKKPVEPASPPTEETDTKVSRWGDSPQPDDERSSDSDNRASPVALTTIQEKQREEEEAEEARVNITGFCSKGKGCKCVYTFRDLSTKSGKVRDPARFNPKLILETTVFGNVSFNNGEERPANAEFAKEMQSLLSSDPRIKLNATGKPIEVRLDKGAMGFFFVNLATHVDAMRAIERISQQGHYDDEEKYHSTPAERSLGFGVCNVGFATQTKKGKKDE
jgi:hypothetical protein